MNRLLTNTDRKNYEPLIQEMFAVAPDIMSRKIGEANVQQAWVLDRVRRTNSNSILCAGCFEDSAFATLGRTSQANLIVGIDPAMNCDLATLAGQPINHGRFGCVFATSVLEHVPDDGQFIRDMCRCLAPGGFGILTADYNAAYKVGDPLPATDVRLYTPADIDRLGTILHECGCEWTSVPDLAGEPDFVYQGHHYSFIALEFKKL